MYDLFPDAISYYNVHVNFMLCFASQVSRPHSRHLYRASIFVGTALLQSTLKIATLEPHLGVNSARIKATIGKVT